MQLISFGQLIHVADVLAHGESEDAFLDLGG